MPEASENDRGLPRCRKRHNESDQKVSDHAAKAPIDNRDLRTRVARFQSPRLHSSLAQALTSIGGYFAVCAAMYWAADFSYWIALALAPVAAGLLVRTFIIQHDCGHNAFFRSRRWNDALGFLCSLLTLAPYLSWRRQHAGHHGVWNNLDRRDSGADIYSSCLTVDEYHALSPWHRRWYRITRNPIVANIILPPLVFLVLYRFPFDMPADWRRERLGVYATNAALVVLVVGLGLIVGFDRVALVQLPVMALASIIGVWLFTVQHRSDHTVWARQSEWTALGASLEGSNYLRLTPVLQWFTGNIGLHHVHHLNPSIPNYRLQQCHDAVDVLNDVPVMTLGSAFKAMFYVLWDEQRHRMVTFRTASLGWLRPKPA
jgi:omega-6 fatty acid desaturase (delta-12 desaturase)